jgi:hypothetical protein
MHHEDRINWQRITKTAFYGFCVGGPATAKWYRFLERHSSWPLATKVALDQLLFSPIFLGICFTWNLGFAFWRPSCSNNNDDKQQKTSLKTYFDAFCTGLCFWPLFQLGNFWFVPVRMRIIAVNVAAIGWNTWICGKVHSINGK